MVDVVSLYLLDLEIPKPLFDLRYVLLLYWVLFWVVTDRTCGYDHVNFGVTRSYKFEGSFRIINRFLDIKQLLAISSAYHKCMCFKKNLFKVYQ